MGFARILPHAFSDRCLPRPVDLRRPGAGAELADQAGHPDRAVRARRHDRHCRPHHRPAIDAQSSARLSWSKISAVPAARSAPPMPRARCPTAIPCSWRPWRTPWRRASTNRSPMISRRISIRSPSSRRCRISWSSIRSCR